MNVSSIKEEKMKKITIISFLMSIFYMNIFSAQTEIDGVIFGSYNFYSSDYRKNGLKSRDYNTFDIGRIYLSALTKHSEDYISKLTLEGNTLSSGNNIFLKLAYLQYKSRENNLSVSFGLIPSVWVGYEESYWKNVFVEYTQMHYLKIINPSDKGVSLSYKVDKISSVFDFMISNGEGFKNTEPSKTKNVEIKFSNYYKKINTSLYYSSNLGDKEKDRIAFLVNIPFNSKISFTASAFKYIDYSTSTLNIKGSGSSVYLNMDISDDYSCFIRWDRFDKNKSKSNDINDYFIFGGLKRLTEDIKLALSYKLSIPQKESLTEKKEEIIQSSFNVKF